MKKSAFILLCAFLLAAWALVGPFKARDGNLGPVIELLLFGERANWLDIAYEIMRKELASQAGSSSPSAKSFYAVVADGRASLFRPDDEEQEQEGMWIAVKFYTEPKERLFRAKIWAGSKKALRRLPRGVIPDTKLYEWCKENGLHYAWVGDSATLYKDRLISGDKGAGKR